MGEVGFTYDWYRAFLADLKDWGRRFRSYDDTLAAGDVLLRHDVDLSPRKALRIAQFEAALGVHATYFFLCSSPLYNLHEDRMRSVVRRIEDLGHDVGLHFSTHQYWSVDGDDPPSDEAVARRVDGERATLEVVASDPIEAVSFHIPPEWVLRRTFDGIDSTYEPRFFTDIDYSADSNQRWRDDPPEPESFGEKVQILTHPGLWGETDATFDQRVRQAETAETEWLRSYTESRYLKHRVSSN